MNTNEPVSFEKQHAPDRPTSVEMTKRGSQPEQPPAAPVNFRKQGQIPPIATPNPRTDAHTSAGATVVPPAPRSTAQTPAHGDAGAPPWMMNPASPTAPPRPAPWQQTRHPAGPAHFAPADSAPRIAGFAGSSDPWPPAKRRSRTGLLVAGGIGALLVVAVVIAYLVAGTGNGSSTVAGQGPTTTSTQAATSGPATAAQTDQTPSEAAPTIATTQVRPPSPTPQPPADLPQLPNRNTPVPRDAPLPANPTNPAVISFRDSSATPSSAVELEDWRPGRLTANGSQAITAIERYMLAVNAQNFDLAWNVSTYRRHAPSPDSSFTHGYATSAFYQSAFGTPVQVSTDLIVVPDRFVSRQDPAAQGYPDGVTDCSLWPQYLWLVAKVNGRWIPDTAGDYTDAAAVQRFKRRGADGNLYLSPVAQRTSC
jgi:hypothetical protein